MLTHITEVSTLAVQRGTGLALLYDKTVRKALHEASTDADEKKIKALTDLMVDVAPADAIRLIDRTKDAASVSSFVRDPYAHKFRQPVIPADQVPTVGQLAQPVGGQAAAPKGHKVKKGTDQPAPHKGGGKWSRNDRRHPGKAPQEARGQGDRRRRSRSRGKGRGRRSPRPQGQARAHNDQPANQAAQ